MKIIHDSFFTIYEFILLIIMMIFAVVFYERIDSGKANFFIFAIAVGMAIQTIAHKRIIKDLLNRIKNLEEKKKDS